MSELRSRLLLLQGAEVSERNNVSCQLACLEQQYRDAQKAGGPMEKHMPLMLVMQQLFELNQQRKAKKGKNVKP